jgi:hypothetical protein
MYLKLCLKRDRSAKLFRLKSGTVVATGPNSIRILQSSSKINKKTLDFYCFLSSFICEKCCIPGMYLQKVRSKKNNFLFVSCRPMTKRAGSGSISQRYTASLICFIKVEIKFCTFLIGYYEYVTLHDEPYHLIYKNPGITLLIFVADPSFGNFCTRNGKIRIRNSADVDP